MLRKHFMALVLVSLAPRVWAVEEVVESTNSVEMPEPDPTTSSEESEAKGIIPANALDVQKSTSPLIPTSFYQAKKPYDQAREELIRAHELWSAGHAEAASDKALEAYDDLVALRRVPGVKRSTIKAQTHQAAAIYVEAGIAYVKGWVKKQGGTPSAIEEGVGRMGDLRDVAKNYPELNRMLNRAISELSTGTSEKPPVKSKRS